MAETQKSPLDMPQYKLPDPHKLAENLPKIAETSQRLVQDYLKRQAEGDNFTVPDPRVVGKSFLELTQKMMADPGSLMQAQMHFWQEYTQLWQQASRRMLGEQLEPTAKPRAEDKRFKGEEWAEYAVFDFIKQSYLLAASSIQNTVRDVKGLDEKTARRVDFYTQQFTDALSPTNFLMTNPQVLKKTLETGGENLVKGLANMLEDLEKGKGQLRVRMTDPKAFTPGENVATTPGKVIYQNELMQLLQYQPSTEKVFRRPLLIVPPWINKFYILDLRPKNSFIKWAVDQGFTVFVISWVNPDERLADRDFEDYVREGVLEALDAIEQATGEREVNAVGYCIGGTLLASALAYMAAKKDERIRTGTFFTSMTDFADVGELEIFIDEEQLEYIDKHMEEKGFLEGRHMANVFNMLRANDLIWSFAVKNYLMGEEPFPFDLLYWNSDSTRMPRKMHNFYLRNMYQHNLLSKPGGITLLGEPIDLGKVEIPLYFLSAKEDHIAPWKSTYVGTQLMKGPAKFVLGGSGHIAGVINPPSVNKYGYWTNSKLPASPDEWFEGAKHHEGSWWTDWFKWVKRYAGAEVEARVPGEGKLKPIEDAPGSYVKVRIEE